MKKMTNYIIIAVVTAVITAIIALGVKETEIDALKLAHKTELEIKDHKIRSLASLERNVSVFYKNSEKENDRLKAETEMLNDVIVRMRTEPYTYDPMERIPPGNTNWYALEPYTKITDTASEQYALQEECETGLATGARIYTDKDGNSYYTVAMGSAYGRCIGDAWEVTLDNGESFGIMLGDFKDDGSTEFFGHPCRNAREEPCTCVIEFIVDWVQTPSAVRERGSMSALGWCNGNIIKLEYLGKRWET